MVVGVCVGFENRREANEQMGCSNSSTQGVLLVYLLHVSFVCLSTIFWLTCNTREM